MASSIKVVKESTKGVGSGTAVITRMLSLLGPEISVKPIVRRLALSDI